MTQPPNASAAPPAAGPPATVVAVPPQSAHAQAPPPGQRRGTAAGEGVARLRAAAVTEPGRLRLIGAGLALLIVVFGAVSAWQSSDRSSAAHDVRHGSQPLSSAAATIYTALADANTAASTGFLAGGQEPEKVTSAYDRDISTAATTLADAATSTDPDSPAAEAITALNQMLPQYTGLVERARANNRLGLPLGAAYLRYANDLMQGKNQMLDQAEKLYQRQNGQLDDDYGDARSFPWIAVAVGLVTLAALVLAQRRHYRRTNRVFNRGLLGATAASLAALLWLTVGHGLARADLDDSYDHGLRSLTVLNDARIASLKARGNENLTLVNRGAETVRVGKTSEDKYDYDYQQQMKALGGADGTQGLLASATSLADDPEGRGPLDRAAKDLKEWRSRHQAARKADTEGNYAGALSKVIGTSDDQSTNDSFTRLDDELQRALAQEEHDFTTAADSGVGDTWGLTAGAAVLAVLGAGGALLGVGRRLSEYR
ncbi:hypothetical protein [Streptomyces sp. NPDC050560]|uniref:hypothetical protein n=1 Tax=Streptomyces sp. NPDC050560 TaxID=3365630 RepID=UPI0037A6BA63